MLNHRWKRQRIREVNRMRAQPFHQVAKGKWRAENNDEKDSTRFFIAKLVLNRNQNSKKETEKEQAHTEARDRQSFHVHWNHRRGHHLNQRAQHKNETSRYFARTTDFRIYGVAHSSEVPLYLYSSVIT